MSWGSTTSQQQQQQSNTAGSSLSMPVQTPWAAALQGNTFAPAVQSLVQKAGMPVFGTANTAQYLQGLNDSTNQGQSHLASSLAGRGILNSGAYATGASQLEQNRQSNMSNFYSQLPFQEQQAQQQNLSRALATGFALTGPSPTGQAQTSSQNSNSSGSSTTTTDPGLSGLVSSLMGVGLSAALGGFGGSGGGLFGGGGSSMQGPPSGLGSFAQGNAMQGAYGMMGQYTPYGAPSSMMSGLPGWAGVS